LAFFHTLAIFLGASSHFGDFFWRFESPEKINKVRKNAKKNRQSVKKRQNQFWRFDFGVSSRE